MRRPMRKHLIGTAVVIFALLPSARADVPAAPASTWKLPDLWSVTVETVAGDAHQPPRKQVLYISVQGQGLVGAADCWKLGIADDSAKPGPVELQYFVWVDKRTSWVRKVLQYSVKDRKATSPEIIKELGDAGMITGAPEWFPIEVFPVDGAGTWVRPLTGPSPRGEGVRTAERSRWSSRRKSRGNRFVVEARLMKGTSRRCASGSAGSPAKNGGANMSATWMAS